MSKYTKEELALYKVAVGDAKEGTAEEIIQSCEEEAEFKRKVHEVVAPLAEEIRMSYSNKMMDTLMDNHYAELRFSDMREIANLVEKQTKDTFFKIVVVSAFIGLALMVNNTRTELETIREYMVNISLHKG